VLAGSGVRHGVQCGGARRRSKSRYSAAIRQKLMVTPRPLSIPQREIAHQRRAA